MMDLLQWPGMALGLLGAPLVASRRARIRRYGFARLLIRQGSRFVLPDPLTVNH